MAKLTTCGTCGHQVSSTATQCPNCGQKFKKKTSIFTWAVAGLIGVPFLFGIFKSASQPTQSTPEPIVTEQKAPSKYESMDKYSVDESNFDNYLGARAAVAQVLIKKEMKDPSSAEFRNLKVVKAKKELPATVCGEASGKDSMGNQRPFKLFLFKTDTGDFGAEGTTPNFAKNWQKFCVMK